jgi:serine/threonine protein kinase
VADAPIDIKGDNILLGIEDESILDDFTTAELQDPSLRKRLDNYTVYVSRAFNLPNKIGRAVLSDFGSVMDGSKIQTSDEQPDVYRCPEVMLKAEWSYEINIWNVGVMVCTVRSNAHDCQSTNEH